MASKVVNKLIVSKDIKRLDISAPEIARRVKPGQFVMILVDEKAEWIPLTVVDADGGKGMITVFSQERGDATRALAEVPINGPLFAVTGPWGLPASVEHYGTVVCVANGVGTATLLSICRALKKEGNRVIGVLEGKKRKDILLESQMRIATHKLFVTTEEGASDRKGKALKVVEDVVRKEEVARIYAIGSTEMMEEMAGLTAEKGIPLRVFLPTRMICGAGICGSCRAEVDNQVVLTCQHGPEFDGQKVNYKQLRIRQQVEEVAWKAGLARSQQKTKGGLSGLWAGLIGDSSGK